jgi:hypothetical protein
VVVACQKLLQHPDCKSCYKYCCADCCDIRYECHFLLLSRELDYTHFKSGIQIVAQLDFSSQEFYTSANSPPGIPQARKSNSGEKKWEVIEANFPPSLV